MPSSADYKGRETWWVKGMKSMKWIFKGDGNSLESQLEFGLK